MLIKETLYSTNKKLYSALNVKKHGFFLAIENKKPPIINTLAYYHILRQARKLDLVQNRLIIKLPEKPNIKPKKYAKILTTPESKNI